MAIEALRQLPKTQPTNVSSFYYSAPEKGGPPEQPDYVNAVAELQTTLSVFDLLSQLQTIEVQQGRIRSGARGEARTLDLDILLYGEQHFNTENLTVPHPRMLTRAFVLEPLFEIAPHLKQTITVV